MEEVDSGAEGLGPIEVTLSSVAGVVGVSFIRLIGKIRGKKISFLVDSGTTHNFFVCSGKVGFSTKRVEILASHYCCWGEVIWGLLL